MGNSGEDCNYLKSVLHVVTSLDFGGVESHMRVIAENRDLSGFRHEFCAISRGGDAEKKLRLMGCGIYILNSESRIPSISALVSLVGLIRQREPTIVHSHGAEANFHGTLASLLSGTKVRLAEEIGFPRHSLRARLAFRAVYLLASRVVAVSRSVAEEIIRLREVRSEKVTVLHNPLPRVTKPSKKPKSKGFELGFVGRLDEVKNLRNLIRAISILRHRGLEMRLVIVGSGPEDKALCHLVDTLEMSSYVKFVGQSGNPFGELGNCDLFVLPSKTEGFGIALIEAMSLSIPVLASHVGGGSEIIENSVNGWIMKSLDADGIADSVHEIMRLTNAERQEVANRGATHVRAAFSAETYFEKLDSLYAHLLSTKKIV